MLSSSHGTSSTITICAFCYKHCATNNSCSFKHSNDRTSSPSNILINRFFSILERFGKNEEKFAKGVANFNCWSKWVGCCDRCLVMIEAICEDYHKLKCLELQMQCKLECLMDTMKVAGRVPSRWVKLQKTFESNVSKLQESNGNPNSTPGNKSQDCLEGLRQFRQKVITKCTGQRLKSLPRVTLKKISVTNNRRSSEMNHQTMETGSLPGPHENFGQDHWIDMEIKVEAAELENPKIITNTSTVSGDDEDYSGAYNDCNSTRSDSSCSEAEPEPEREKTALPKSLQQNEDGTDRFQCVVCDKKFQLSCALKNHVKIVHKENTHSKKNLYKCSICGKGFPYIFRLEEHFTINHTSVADRKFRCSICGSKHHSERRLRMHMTDVHCPRTHTCSVCGKAFKKKTGLDIHSESHKDPSEWKFPCPKCGRKFPLKWRLKEHMRMYASRKCPENRHLKSFRNINARNVKVEIMTDETNSE